MNLFLICYEIFLFLFPPCQQSLITGEIDRGKVSKSLFFMMKIPQNDNSSFFYLVFIISMSFKIDRSHDFRM